MKTLQEYPNMPLKNQPIKKKKRHNQKKHTPNPKNTPHNLKIILLHKKSLQFKTILERRVPHRKLYHSFIDVMLINQVGMILLSANL